MLHPRFFSGAVAAALFALAPIFAEAQVTPIANGGTNASSQTTNGVAYFNGTEITTGSALTWDGTYFSVGGILQINNATASRDFTLYSQNTSVSFPVPTFAPVSTTSPLALDVFPGSGTVVQSPGNGYAWIDVCNAQVSATCARVGVTSAEIVLGNNSFGGTPLPTAFTANSIEGMRIDTSGHVGVSSTGATVSFAQLFVQSDIFNNNTTQNSGIYISNSLGAYSLIQSTNASGATSGPLVLNLNGGNVGIGGATSPLATLDVHGTFRVLQASPASSASCEAGQIVADTSYLYTCASSGAWKRVAVTGGY